ncbi:MAG: glycine C-acetyltransferase [Tissierellia bacterium]|nr:glycine C-acetyltransferase [Tissierellia bacterium]
MSNRSSIQFFEEKIQDLKSKGTYKELPVLQGANDAEILLNGKKVINLCSNNYLGLVNHPKVKKASIEAIEKYGVGASSARNIIANTDLYEKMESLLAEFKREEAVLVSQSGFNCNIGTIPAITEKGDLIISDELNHASIIDGIRLSKADKKIYDHLDMDSLEKILKENRKNYKKTLIITDSVFSMDGDIAPLPEIVELAKQYDAMTYVDDAHGTGILGEGGRGTVDYFGLNGQVDFTMGTLSKAIPVIGGYIAGSKAMKEWLLRNARPILFSTCIPPAAIGAVIKITELMMDSTEQVDKLWENTNYFKEKLSGLGFNIGNSKTPIIPVIIGEEDKAVDFSNKLLENRVLASSIIFPVVPRGTGRVRCIVTAEHTKEQLDKCIEVFTKVGKEMDIL